MASLATFIRFEVLGFLAALALIVSIQLVTGKINRRRLLYAKERATTENKKVNPSAQGWISGLSLSRIQLFIVSIAVAIYVFVQVVRDPGQIPEIPTWLLLLMAGSEAIYLARKANNLGLRRSIRSNSQT